MAKNNAIVWILIGAIALVALGVVDLPNFGTGDSEGDTLYPSDLTATVTLNTGNALATTSTNANVSYYIFNEAGKFLKEGTTSAGTDSFSLPTPGDYTVILYKDDDSGTDYLPTEISISVAGQGELTENVDLLAESAATIDKVRDPVDLDSNVSTGAGQAINFDVLISASTSRAALRKPIVVVNTNRTSFDASTSLKGLNPVSCPDRLSPATNRRLECFEYDGNILSSDGIVTISGSLQADSTNAPASSDVVNVTVIDQGIYIEPGYRTAGYSAFKYGAEDPISNSNVGAADSDTSSLYLNG